MSAIKTSAAPPRARAGAAGQNQFVERFAVALETDGFPRIAGRIFGLLIISDDDVSLDEIGEAVGASKASVSVNTRMLEEKGLIDRVSHTGDRRDYYKLSADPFVRTMESRLLRWDRVREVVGEGMTDPSLPASARGRLKDFDAASQELRDLLSAALVRLRNRRKR
jgi:DNA-binding MarR family transcriptional regulator